MLKPILWPVLVPSLLFSIGIGATIPVYVLAALQLGAGNALASGTVTLMGAVSLIFTVPVGILIDRVGDRRAMTLGTVAAVVVTALTVFALAAPLAQPLALTLYIVLLLLRAPVEDIWRLARQAVVAEHIPPAHLGKAMTALGGTMRVGNLLGPLISAALLVWLPLWSVYVFSCLCAVLAVVILNIPALNRGFDDAAARSSRAGTEEPVPEIGAATGAAEPEGPAEAAADLAERAEPAPPSPRPSLRALAVDWHAVWLAGVGILVLAVARVLQPLMVQLWGASIGLHESGISLLVAVGAAIELVLMFPGGYLKDRLGRVAVLTACLAVFGAGFVLMGAVPTVAGLVAAVVVMAVGNGLGAGVNMTIGADLSPAVSRARFLGVWAVFTNAGQLGGPALVSALLSIASLPAALICAGAVTLGGAVWTAATGRRTGLPGPRR